MPPDGRKYIIAGLINFQGIYIVFYGFSIFIF